MYTTTLEKIIKKAETVYFIPSKFTPKKSKGAIILFPDTKIKVYALKKGEALSNLDKKAKELGILPIVYSSGMFKGPFCFKLNYQYKPL